MKSKAILFFCLLYSPFLLAQSINVNEARQKALEFLSNEPTFVKERNRAPKKLSHLKLVHQKPIDNGQNAYYIFNNETGGFVIVSGDDRAETILGYSDKGKFDAVDMPENIKGWLDEYANQVKYIRDHHLTSSVSRRSPTRSAITPLLTTTWDQGYPYNDNCPDFFGQDKCITGCEATALAQVMYYHRQKSVTKTTATIPGYTCEREWTIDSKKCQITVDAIPAGSPIDWNNMCDSYNGSETQVQIQAIANLMKYCGASMSMDYAIGQSDAHIANAPIALKTYFGYSNATELKWRDYVSSDEEWENLIYAELSNNRPVFYHGMHGLDDDSDGHVFVCDGYDGSGYYHFNWGWSGSYDGYFLLSAIGPRENHLYPYWQAALINAEPKIAISLSTDAIELFVNMSENVEIHNGSGEYEIINDYPNIIESEIDVITHVSTRREPREKDEGEIDYDVWHITGKSVGNAVLKLKDLKTNEILSLNVSVLQPPSLSLETESLTLSIGDEVNVEILTGSGLYSVTSDDPQVATAQKWNSITWDDDFNTIYATVISVNAQSPGTATITVKDLSSLEEKKISVSVVLTGDVNNDGVVDISDYIGVANYILSLAPEGFNEKAADVNNDGAIDISDYIGVANIILTGKP